MKQQQQPQQQRRAAALQRSSSVPPPPPFSRGVQVAGRGQGERRSPCFCSGTRRLQQEQDAGSCWRRAFERAHGGELRRRRTHDASPQPGGDLPGRLGQRFGLPGAHPRIPAHQAGRQLPDRPEVGRRLLRQSARRVACCDRRKGSFLLRRFPFFFAWAISRQRTPGSLY